ncbi:MAG: zinc-dependent metalloprotease [Saprospiraceae bacterium]|nr:zinc-dependent metalloprotease [Saprospiraceae bacterium]
MLKNIFLCTLALCCFQISFAQDGNKDKKDKKKEPKKYTDVITDKAVSSEGLFTTHDVDGTHYFEIPDSVLGKEILVVSRISGFVKNLNFGGAGVKSRPQQVIRWEKIGKKMALRSVSYNSVASFEDPIYQSVKNNNFEPIIMMFDLEIPGDSVYLIKVDPLFTSDIPMIGAVNEGQRKNFGIKGLDSKRSMVTSMRSFPKNVEVRHILTYKGGNKLPDNRVTGTLSVEMNQSFIMLPKEPMEPRYYDARVGYFSVRQTNYSLDDQRTETERFITRWRLEPKDPEAYARGELVEPIKPIVYYIDPATPKKWVPYLMQGVNDWQSAFEKAGFKNAIYALEAPSPEENPDWSPEDTRYSVIRYVSTDIQNAMGPHVHDPRTGEILESDIIWYHNIMRLLRNWFFIHTSAINPEARGVNFKDEVMGRLIRFVSAHEVGHTLGLPHNMGSSVAYPVDSLRSPSFTKKMGTAPSIMDYARFNYVAQPEDGDVGLMPEIGPYDDWSIMYGYKLIPQASNRFDEKPILNEWIKERADNPLYRYGRQRGLPLDPTSQTEDLGDDAMHASELGIKNLKRIVPNIAEWGYEEGEDYDQIRDLYQQVFSQFRRYLGHVIANVGGVIEISKSQDQEENTYTHQSKTNQKRAMAFLNQHLFTSPVWMIDDELTRKFEEDGAIDRIKSLQSGVLRQLFNTGRLNRMIENEALNGKQAYSVYELFNDTENYLFGSVMENNDVYQRNLQRYYIERMKNLVEEDGNNVVISDIKAAALGSLKSIQKRVKKAKNMDDINGYHQMDIKMRVDKILE